VTLHIVDVRVTRLINITYLLTYMALFSRLRLFKFIWALIG